MLSLQAECKCDLRTEDHRAFHMLEGRGQGSESQSRTVRLGHVCGRGFILTPRGLKGGHLGLSKGWELSVLSFGKICVAFCAEEGLWEP